MLKEEETSPNAQSVTTMQWFIAKTTGGTFVANAMIWRTIGKHMKQAKL
jgi:hypothetical protein